MSRSGVGLAQDVVPTFEELKLGKKLLFIVYKLSTDFKTIEVEKTVDKDPAKDLKGQYEDFVTSLPEEGCRYVVYDFSFELSAGEGTRNKICFFTWSPDSAPIKSKMLSASSKDALRRALNGIHAEIQGTDFSEVSYEAVLGRFVTRPAT